MKIAIDARIINSSTGRYVERLLTYLERLDSDHDYLVLVRKKDMDYWRPTNPRFQLVEADFADYSFAEQIGFARLLYRLKPDLVHFCMPQQPIFYTRPSITTVHDLNLLRITSNDDMGTLELFVKKLIFRGVLWVVAHRNKHILTPSEFTKRDLVEFSRISPQKITVTYEGADTATAEPKPVEQLKNKRFILYVGRAEPYKNNRGLIEAHQQLLAKHPDLHLVIVGKKDVLREADIQWATEHGLAVNVDFLGFVSDEELAWLYKHCQAYIVPSLMEGFGLPGLEAMGSGAPVVSSNTTCLPEVYQDGAHYFDPHDSGDMARAIDEVVSSENLRATLIENAKKVHAQYSWKRMAEQTLATYQQVLNRR
ncbi:MAG: glycosyltransferase family 4 protein [Candidatus Saccharimonadales bacterium]